jgi:hypothetical protein
LPLEEFEEWLMYGEIEAERLEAEKARWKVEAQKR